jgi:hypothetical protein
LGYSPTQAGQGASMDLPDRMTVAEAYGPAMEVTTREEAQEYFEALVARCMRINHVSREQAERIERSNVGYFTGYCDSETAARCHALYGFGHPLFGTSRPSYEEAFLAGMAVADARKASK